MNETNEPQQLPLGLYWKDKKTTVDRIVLPFQNLEVIETINESRATREKEKGSMFRKDPNALEVDWRNKLIWGDNKYVMSALLEKYSGQVDLIYIDPPFATGANFSTTVSIGDNEIEHTKDANAMEELAYRDTWGKGLDSFLQMMYDRLILMRDLLSEKGSIYVHLDYRTAAYVKVLLDEIMGSDRYCNAIVWKRGRMKGAKAVGHQYGRNHDIILLYSKSSKFCYNRQFIPYTKEYIKQRYTKNDNDGKGSYTDQPIGTRSKKAIERLREEGRVFKTKGGTERIKFYLSKMPGIALDDVWIDIDEVNSMAEVNLRYPTQKPEPLLERIIKTSSNQGDLIADFFGGSGTTAAVAEKLGRRWITSDLGRYAIHTTRKRLFELEGCRPFEILNIGKYERQYWQTFNFGKKSLEQTLAEYTSFILKLFIAEPLPGSAYIHGKKGVKLVHVGGVDSPVTLSDIQNAL